MAPLKCTYVLVRNIAISFAFEVAAAALIAVAHRFFDNLKICAETVLGRALGDVPRSLGQRRRVTLPSAEVLL